MLVPFLVLAAAFSDVPVSAKVPANGVAMPMRIVQGKVIVDAKINGKGPFPLFLDTGNNLLRLEGEAAPADPKPAAQSEYAGRYGTRTISTENGELYLQRDGGPRLKLTTIAPDELGIEGIPAARLRFVRGANGKVTELHVLNREGVWEKSARE
jgi:hypothetical protein